MIEKNEGGDSFSSQEIFEEEFILKVGMEFDTELAAYQFYQT